MYANKIASVFKNIEEVVEAKAEERYEEGYQKNLIFG